MKKLAKIFSAALVLLLLVGLLPGMSLRAKAEDTEYTYTVLITYKTYNGDTKKWRDTNYKFNEEISVDKSNFNSLNSYFKNLDSVTSISGIVSSASVDGGNLKLTVSGAGYDAQIKGKYYSKVSSTPMDFTLTVDCWKNPSPVSTVSLNKTTAEIAIGETVALSATVLPTDANKTVTWSSDTPTVATVANGVVSGVAVGTATITVTATNGTSDTTDDKTATCTVTVKKRANPMTYAETQTVEKTFSTAAQTATLTAAENAQGDVTYAVYSQKDSSDAEVSYFTVSGTTLTLAANTPAGTYTVVVSATASGSDNYNGAIKYSTVTVTVGKADQTVTAPAAKTGLEYTGSAQALVDAASITEGNTAAGVEYSLNGGDWGSSIPQATNAGEYTVNYKVAGNDNYNAFTGTSVSVTIAKANQTVTAPTAKTGLKYKGEAQTLVEAASITKGNDAAGVQYSLDGETYSADIPQGTNAGNYTVYYKVAGNGNYNEYTGDPAVSVSIIKADPETPTGLQAKPGQKLSDLTLPDGWAWDAPDTVLDETGEKTFRATFTETANYVGKQVDVTVTVSETPVTGVTFDKTALTVKEGESAALTATVAPADATIKTVKYTSSDENVVTVGADGKVTAKAPGKATVTVTTDDGAKTATCEVTVPYEVKITSGNGGKHKKEKDGDLEFVFEIAGHNADTYPAFEKAVKVVTVNDKQLKDSDFKAESGSLKLTLTKKYLDSLKAGSYTVNAKFMLNGLEQTGTASFKVLTSSGGSSEPKTGDDTKTSGLIFALILFMLSLAYVAYSVYSIARANPKLLTVSADAIESGAQTEEQEDGVDNITAEQPTDEGSDDIIE